MQHFDPQAFMDLTVEETFERRPPIPATNLYPATISNLAPRQWTSKDKYNEDGTLKNGIAYDVELQVELPLDVQQACNLKSQIFTTRDSIMVDLNERGGLSTEPGANRQMRMYREAAGLNTPGQPFSPRQLIGKRVAVAFKHEEYPAGSGELREVVKGVAKLA